MGLCCMVLTDDGSGGGETNVEGKEIAAVLKDTLQRAGWFQKKKKKKRKMVRQIG